MAALERVEIDRAARLKVIKGGGAQSIFGKQSPVSRYDCESLS